MCSYMHIYKFYNFDMFNLKINTNYKIYMHAQQNSAGYFKLTSRLNRKYSNVIMYIIKISVVTIYNRDRCWYGSYQLIYSDMDYNDVNCYTEKT